MDSFTENILTRARERQRLLDATTPRKPDSSPLEALSGNKNDRFFSHTSSPTKTLNIRQQDFDMEIKVTSAEEVHVEVHIQEEDEHPKRGLRKLADLAQNINQWEDDLTSTRKIDTKPTPKKCKPLAPQPPKNSPVKQKATQPPSSVKWDKKVLDSLESQGFTRTESNSKLIYKYDKENPPNRGSVANKAAIFESASNGSPKTIQKDPSMLSLAERKALFERNKGDAPVPKAPFAMATPVKKYPPVTSPAVKSTPKISAFTPKQSSMGKHDEIKVVNVAPKEEEIMEITSPPAKIEKRRSSGNKRNSTSDSPKVAAVLNEVKRIKVTPQKPGRLYPSLTDIESQTETETRSPTPANSSYESDDNNISSGTSYSFSFEKAEPEPTTSEQRASIPERRQSVHEQPIVPEPEPKSPDLPTHIVDGDEVLPLTHTVSFYRKQQQEQNVFKQVSRKAPLLETPEEDDENEEKEVDEKIKMLEEELPKQEAIISQTSQALNLCNSTPEFMGSTEHVEAERVLLLASHRRQMAVQELQRLRVERTLHPKVSSPDSKHLSRPGTLIINKIVLPLKEKYVTALAATGGKGHHVVCLIKYLDRVVSTQLVSTVASSRKNPECDLTIPGTLTLENVQSDCTFTFEVYCLQAQEEQMPHDVKYHIKKTGGGLLTPKKKTTIKFKLGGSPAGPLAVRSPTFALMGYAIICGLNNRKRWTLNNAPSMSPLDGVVEMSLKFERAPVSTEHRGFLTMFEDVSGFGAWHRRWCQLKHNTLNYWKYPDDERKQAPINSIDLSKCVTQHVGPVSRDICARLHTFLLEIERDAREGDRHTLVTMKKGDKTIVRHLLSADTKEERIEWCDKLNEVLDSIDH